MSKKPAAALSASLVAIKGAAAPVPDMPVRTAAEVVQEPAVASLESASGLQRGAGEGGGQPLNFRVSDTFRRDFKVYAAQHGLKLNELLRLSFEAYRRQNNQ